MVTEIFFEFAVGICDLVIPVPNIDKTGDFVKQLFVIFFRSGKPAFITALIKTKVFVKISVFQRPGDIKIKGL